eukprot:g31008.t1
MWERLHQLLSLDPHRLMSIYDQFELASGAKVCRDSMYKTLDKWGKNRPGIALILMFTFMCGCFKLCVDPRYANSKCHYKFVKKIAFDHKSTRKWSAHSVLKSLREKERMDPVTCFLEQNVKAIWQDTSLPELSSKHQAITWLVNPYNVEASHSAHRVPTQTYTPQPIP